MIKSGELRHRLMLEELTLLLDSNGDVAQDEQTGETTSVWTEVDTYWAAIKAMSVREFIAAQATQSQVTTRLVLRKPPRIDAAMRFVHMVKGIRSTIYNIHGILPDPESGLEYITCPVSAGVSDSGQ
jgi:SPP1 family predicted phage head-tail adaptor